ncbi:MAG: PolC-type DNA polymerase III [Mycoplasmatales bacterium]
MIKKKIQEVEYVIFDIETTGFNPINDQIIEIGAVKINGEGKVIAEFQKFISLYKVNKLPKKIIELTHIDDKMLQQQGIDIDIVMEQFYKFFKGTVLVAQNTKFDMSFIDTYYLKDKAIFLENLTLDTIDLAKKIYPNKKTYKLAKLIEYFNVDYDADAHHRADYDALITSQIFIKGMTEIIQKENKQDIKELVEIFNIEEATQNQKRYLYTLLKSNEITLEQKVYLSKFNAARQISILASDE